MRLARRPPISPASTAFRKRRCIIGSQVWRHGRLRGEALEGARGRERQAEEAAGGSHARYGGASRASFKKMVGPAAKREGVAHLQAAMGLSERRACTIVSADRTMIRYRSRRPPDTALRDAAPRSRQRAPALRLSAAVHPAAAGGRAVRDQPHLPALSRGRPYGAQAARRGDGPSARARRSWSRPGPMRAGRSISSTISSPMAGAFAS